MKEDIKENKKEKGFLKKLIDNVTENVIEGATFVGEKVAETSAKAFVASSELVSETSEKIHEYTEKQTLQKEEKKIRNRQKEIISEFGEQTLKHYLMNDSLHKSFLTTKAISTLVEEYKTNESKSEVLTEEIKKLEKHK